MLNWFQVLMAKMQGRERDKEMRDRGRGLLSLSGIVVEGGVSCGKTRLL